MSDLTTTKLGVTFEMTMDEHSRKVFYHGAFIGTLLFHDWEFKLDLGPAVPLRLEIAAAILEKAQEDTSILNQHREDQEAALAHLKNL
jgi:hypothetical protein